MPWLLAVWACCCATSFCLELVRVQQVPAHYTSAALEYPRSAAGIPVFWVNRKRRIPPATVTSDYVAEDVSALQAIFWGK